MGTDFKNECQAVCNKLQITKDQSFVSTDYGHPEKKQSSLHGRKFNPNSKFLGVAEAYFVCHIDPIFQTSLIYAFIGFPQSVISTIQSLNSNSNTYFVTKGSTFQSLSPRKSKLGRQILFLLREQNTNKNHNPLQVFSARQYKKVLTEI